MGLIVVGTTSKGPYEAKFVPMGGGWPVRPDAIREGRIEVQIAHRVPQAIDVLVELVELVADRAQGVEDGVAVEEAAVAQRDPDFGFGQDLAVVPGDAFGRLAHERILRRYGRVGAVSEAYDPGIPSKLKLVKHVLDRMVSLSLLLINLAIVIGATSRIIEFLYQVGYWRRDPIFTERSEGLVIIALASASFGAVGIIRFFLGRREI